MSKIYMCLFLFLFGISFTIQKVSSQLSCKLNIDASGKYLQIGTIGGNNSRWIMKGTMSCITHNTPSTGDPTGWEGGALMINNWNDKEAQMDAMKNSGINCIRLWMPAPIGRDIPNPSYTGTTMDQHYDEVVQYISLAKSKGLWVLVQDWWGGYLMDGDTDEYYNSGEWHDKMLVFINRLSSAGCDNVMFGTGNECSQIANMAGKVWAGTWKDNTMKMIAGYRRLGYTGPILADTEGWDNNPGDVDFFAEIQNSDPGKNVGFQEHEYFHRDGAANDYYYMPVCRAVYNRGMAMENFAMFVTEYASTVLWIDDEVATYAKNNNFGGWSYFWWNGPYGPCTTDADGINLTEEGIDLKTQFCLAEGMPAGFYPTGVTLSASPASLAIGATTQLKVYPNPVNDGVLNIRIDGQTENASLNIFTIDGSKKYSGILMKGETKLINNLATGTYLIKVSGNNLNEVRKIVIK